MDGLEQLYLRQNYELKTIPREICLLGNLSVLDTKFCDDLQKPPLRIVARGFDSVRAYAEYHYW
jgi:Leucine-rich repeat (LRR) protein